MGEDVAKPNPKMEEPVHRITFYPIGNADTYRIELENGRQVLIDFAHFKVAEGKDDPRIDLAKTIREDLDSVKKKEFDVVLFTHCDEDHVSGANDFFHLEHAKKYQSADRIKIKELWVPASFVLEKSLSVEAARVIQSEARFRLREGKGVRVFSRPELLKDWLKGEGIDWDKTQNLISDAGTIVPGFSTASDGLEFFAHSPFAFHLDGDGALEDRNTHNVILHATFNVAGQETKFILGADAESDVLEQIVKVSEKHSRSERISWDIYKLPHHCSHNGLSPEKGKDKTAPLPLVRRLLEKYSAAGCILVSSSDVIPGKDTDQPPHRQAAAYYKDVAANEDGQFLVTMEYPNTKKPEPLVIEIDSNGATPKKASKSGAAVVVKSIPPRAG